MRTVWSGTTGRDGSPSSPGCTHGKCPKSVKFSTCRDASACQRYGPHGTSCHSSDSSSGTSGSGQRGSSSATQTRPYRSCARNFATRAFAGTRVGSASCGIAVQTPPVS